MGVTSLSGVLPIRIDISITIRVDSLISETQNRSSVEIASVQDVHVCEPVVVSREFGPIRHVDFTCVMVAIAISATDKKKQHTPASSYQHA